MTILWNSLPISHNRPKSQQIKRKKSNILLVINSKLGYLSLNHIKTHIHTKWYSKWEYVAKGEVILHMVLIVIAHGFNRPKWMIHHKWFPGQKYPQGGYAIKMSPLVASHTMKLHNCRKRYIPTKSPLKNIAQWIRSKGRKEKAAVSLQSMQTLLQLPGP